MIDWSLGLYHDIYQQATLTVSDISIKQHICWYPQQIINTWYLKFQMYHDTYQQATLTLSDISVE